MCILKIYYESINQSSIMEGDDDGRTPGKSEVALWWNGGLSKNSWLCQCWEL